ncbi:MAG: polysaccharide biosynthesis tyrosine autokinase [Anaerolineales bacterium]
MEHSPQQFDEQPLSEDLRRYGYLLWRWAWLILLAAALAAGAAYFVSIQMTPVYQASTTVLVDKANTDGSSEYQSLLMSERLTQTYAELLVQKPVLEVVVERLDLAISAEDLEEMITVQPVRDTQLIELQVESTNPELASIAANTLIEVFIVLNNEQQSKRYAASKVSLEAQLERVDQKIIETNTALDRLGEGTAYETERNRLELTLAQYQNTYSGLLQSYEEVRTKEAGSISSIVQVEPASPPEEPVRPRIVTNTALAGVVGAMLAAGFVFLFDALDNTVKNPDQIESVTGLSVIGMVPIYPVEQGSPIAILQPRHPSVEAFRVLRTNLKYTSVDKKILKIMVTSAEPEVGKTELATNLAVVFAQSGNEVMLIDADLRRPKVHHRFGLENRTGLSRVFRRGSDQMDEVVIRNTDLPKLSILTTGPLPPNPSELLGSEKMGDILNSYCNQLDYLIIDTPPILAVTDAIIISQLVDGVLLVVKPGETQIRALKQAVDRLRQVNANLLGVVLNKIPKNGRSYYYEYYSYKNYFDRDEE